MESAKAKTIEEICNECSKKGNKEKQTLKLLVSTNGAMMENYTFDVYLCKEGHKTIKQYLSKAPNALESRDYVVDL